ncbi:hypothetical protein ACSBR2_026684 [Camellia fascicularis]
MQVQTVGCQHEQVGERHQHLLLFFSIEFLIYHQGSKSLLTVLQTQLAVALLFIGHLPLAFEASVSQLTFPLCVLHKVVSASGFVSSNTPISNCLVIMLLTRNKHHSMHVIKLGYPGGVDVRCNPERQAISSVVDDFVAFNMREDDGTGNCSDPIISVEEGRVAIIR